MMIVSTWITVGLVMAAASVATLGAYFSITGLGVLFSGALIAVFAMAGSLEFAKFVLAAYLHQTWKGQNAIYKGYLTFAIVVLSIITSIGIYGFLSDAYQSASAVFEAETVKMESIKASQATISNELARLNKLVDEIPENRVTKRMKMRAELEPQIQQLNKKYTAGEVLLTQSNLRVIEVKKKVGPLMYISKALNMNIDKVVSWLILILVSVFDPLAICLVIAATHAIESRRLGHKENSSTGIAVSGATVFPENLASAIVPAEPVATAQAEVSQHVQESAVASQVQAPQEPEDVIVQMSFKDESEEDKKVI